MATDLECFSLKIDLSDYQKRQDLDNYYKSNAIKDDSKSSQVCYTNPNSFHYYCYAVDYSYVSWMIEADSHVAIHFELSLSGVSFFFLKLLLECEIRVLCLHQQ